MPEEQIIKVVNTVGSPFAISSESGEKLHAEIRPILEQGGKVILDFSQIELIITTFLNAAIGQLYGSFDDAFIQQHVLIENVSKDDEEIFQKVRETSIKYFNNRQNFEDDLKKHFPNA